MPLVLMSRNISITNLKNFLLPKFPLFTTLATKSRLNSTIDILLQFYPSVSKGKSPRNYSSAIKTHQLLELKLLVLLDFQNIYSTPFQSKRALNGFGAKLLQGNGKRSNSWSRTKRSLGLISFLMWFGDGLELKMEMEVMKLVKRGGGKWEWCQVVRLGNLKNIYIYIYYHEINTWKWFPIFMLVTKHCKLKIFLVKYFIAKQTEWKWIIVLHSSVDWKLI